MVYDLPDIIRWGARYRPSARWSCARSVTTRAFPRSRISASCAAANPARWAQMRRSNGGQILQNVPRNYEDSFGVRLGVSIWPSSRSNSSRHGLRIERRPDATFEPGSRIGRALVRARRPHRLGRHVHAALSYTHFVYVPARYTRSLPNSPRPANRRTRAVTTRSNRVGNVNADFAF